jgi:hypothetical protein
LRTVVDGKVNPELISQERAVSLLFISLAGSLDRLEARLASLGLSQQDMLTLKSELTQFRAVMTDLSSKAQAVTASVRVSPTVENIERGRELSLALNAAAWAGYGRLQQTLSRDGTARLTQYIENQKRNIRVLGPSQRTQ